MKNEIEQKNFDYIQIRNKFNDLKNNSEEQLTSLTKAKEQLVVLEKQLRQNIHEYEKTQHDNEMLKKDLIAQNNQFKEQMGNKDKEILLYINEITDKEKAQESLEKLIKQNEEKIEQQENHITQLKMRYENDKAKIQQKEEELAKKQVNLQKSKEEITLLQFDLRSKQEKINSLEEELEEKQTKLSMVQKTSEEKGLEVLEKEEELKKLINERDNLKKENKNHKENIENIKYFYTDGNRNLFEQELIQDEKILNDETIRNSSFEERKFKILYPQLEFEKKFFGEFNKLEENDKIQVEKLLLNLCYKDVQGHFRPNAPTKTREIRFKRDQKGTGKGRIYITNDGKKVLGLTINENDQKRKIQQLL